MKYNIGDLLVCKTPYKSQSTIGIIMEYNDEYDIYAVEWMCDKQRWNEKLPGCYISMRIHINAHECPPDMIFQHIPVK
jgi:hypothetical protein